MSNERVTKGLEHTVFILFDPRTANFMVHIEAEVLEALIDTGWAKIGIQIPDHLISKGLGLMVVLNMETGDNNVS